MSDQTISRYVDLTGVFLITISMSLLLYVISLERPWGSAYLLFWLSLVQISYLPVFLVACKFEQSLKVPRWLAVSLIGSFACAATWLEPRPVFGLGNTLALTALFSCYSIFILGSLNLGRWVVKELRHQSAPISLFSQNSQTSSQQNVFLKQQP